MRQFAFIIEIYLKEKRLSNSQCAVSIENRYFSLNYCYVFSSIFAGSSGIRQNVFENNIEDMQLHVKHSHAVDLVFKKVIEERLALIVQVIISFRMRSCLLN